MTDYTMIKSFLMDAYYSHEITPSDFVFLCEKADRLAEEERKADADFRERLAHLLDIESPPN